MLALATPAVPLLIPPASTRVVEGLVAETVGVSLLPVIANTRALVVAVAVPSLTRMLPKLSVMLCPAVSAWVALALSLRV